MGCGFRILIADIVVRPSHEEAGADFHRGLAGCELVTGEVLDDEAIERFVFVQRANDIVAKRPRIISDQVSLKTLALAKQNDIEPMSPPPFAIARAGEKTIDKALVSVRRRICGKRINFVRRRRKPGEIEGSASDQRASICGR